MTTKENIEARLAALEAEAKRRSSTGEVGLSDEEVVAQLDAIIESLDDDERAALERVEQQPAEEFDDAETGEFDLTDREAAYLDVLTGGKEYL